MDLADFLAQYAFVVFMVLCVAYRKDLKDMENGNIERLIREERETRDVEEARWWLQQIQT